MLRRASGFLLLIALLLVPTWASVAAQGYEATTLTINSDTTLPLDTGIVAASGDEFVIVAHGALQVTTSGLEDSWFDPSGLIRLRRGGQVFGDMPYGSLIGTFDGTAGSGFYLGDGGAFSAQPADAGDELRLALNMSASDQSFASGAFVVTVIRISDASLAAPELAPDVRAQLQSSYPNPFRTATAIGFALERSGSARVDIFDASGRRVRALEAGELAAGQHEIRWNGRGDAGEVLHPGTYFYRVYVDGRAIGTQRALLLDS